MSRRPSRITADEDSVRQRILQATLEVIASDGLDAVRHRRVADLAGVSLGSTTYHFAGRDDLIEAAFVRYLERASAFLDLIVAPTTRSTRPVDAIVGYVERLLTQEFAEVGMVQAEYELILYAARAPGLAEHLRAWEAEQCVRLAALLEAAGAPSPTVGARTLLALIRGLEIERLTSGAPIADLRRRLRAVIGALVADGSPRS